MYFRILALLLVIAIAGCATAPKPKAIPIGSLKKFEVRAAKFHEVVTLPTFETTPTEVNATTDKAIKAGNAALDTIGALKPGEVNFVNTIRALDDMGYELGLACNRLSLIQNTSTNAAVRDAATDAIKIISDWMVGTDYREDVYAALKVYAATSPQLEDEDKKLFDYTLRDYRRVGLD